MLKAIQEEILRLKKEKNAIILAHNYQSIEIQQVADFNGDSLQLSILASKTEAPLIVFCGVRFMAETAAILNPHSKVLLPVLDAGCPMADMISTDQLVQFQQQYPDSVTVCYVNSSVEVKALSDICCTSSNAVKVVSSIPSDKRILFVPDQNLGRWAAEQTKREMVLWKGYCPVHQWQFSIELVKNMQQKFPNYTLIVHPECVLDVAHLADKVMSTGGMVKYVESNDNVILATENGLVDYLKYIYPNKHIECLNTGAICKNMKKTTLNDVWETLLEEKNQITVEADVASKAVTCLERMLALS